MFESFLPSLITGGLNFLGQSDANETNVDLASETRKFNADEAEKNRAFQERLSSTAYQRAVADLSKSGLNPMLAYGHGGASTPGGSQANGTPARVESVANGAASSAAQIALVKSQIAKNEADSRASDAVAGNQIQQGYVNEIEVLNRAEQVGATREMPARMRAETELHSATAARTRAETSQLERKVLGEIQEIASRTQLNYQQARNLVEEKLNIAVKRGLMKAEERHVTAGAILSELEIPRQRNLSNVQDSPWMVHVSPYLRDLFTAGASAAAIRSSTR